MRMKRFVLAAVAALCLVPAAQAQNFTGQLIGGRVVASCGGATYAAGTNNALQVDTTGTLCSAGGGGGGGGAVTVANGADVTQGAVADAAATAGGTGTLSAKLRLMTTQLGTINTTLGTPLQAGGNLGTITALTGITNALPAGANTIGAVTQASGPWSQNQTQVNGVTVATGAGATSTGTQRVGVAQDTTTIAGSAPGTAGSASANVVTVQGVTSMTPILVNGSGSTQPVSGTVTANAGTNLNTSALALETGGNLATTATQSTTTNTNLGAPGATVCATDTGSCSLNALTQRIAQRLTTLNTTLGTPFQAGGSIGNTTFASTQSGTWNITNISGTVTLPTGAATSAAQTTAQSSLTAIAASVAGATPAGSAIIGKVGIDQTTPGTTNAVALSGDGFTPANYVSGVIASAMTSNTSTSLVASPGASLRNYITHIACYNTGAAGTLINVQDGSGGTTIYQLAAAATYGGTSITFPVPLRQPTTATALYVANVSTTTVSTTCSASGYKGAWLTTPANDNLPDWLQQQLGGSNLKAG